MFPLFSEDSTDWEPFPRWADFLVRLGFDWPAGVHRPRRIALVSMPCESAAAGLVALGAQIGGLCNPMANDIDGHFDSLVSYAQQYLDGCLPCRAHCQPERTSCGYLAEATGMVKSINRPVRSFKICEFTALGNRRISFQRNGVTINLFPAGAKDYHIAGEPPPVFANRCVDFLGDIYAQIVADARIFPANLRRSFSEFCLAGRIGGETATKEAYASVGFRCSGGDDYRLCNLLTIHGWGVSSAVSRMTFFNSRTEQFDRRAPPPSLVVADGGESFLKVLARQEFQRSDVVGVFHRAIERDKLEAIGNKLLGLRQWYDDDAEMRQKVANLPRGISIAFLRKRLPQ